LEFAMALPCLIAAWMLSEFCLSQGLSLAAQVVGSPDSRCRWSSA
jgi:hypothetical protein